MEGNNVNYTVILFSHIKGIMFNMDYCFFF